jgi:hypothetical protein
MISTRKTTKVITDIFTFFKKEGKVLTFSQYQTSKAPVRLGTINSRFGSYDRMLSNLRMKHQEEWKSMEDSFKAPIAMEATMTKVETKLPKTTKPVVKKEIK